MKVLAAVLPVLLLSACDPFGLPEDPPETATYYVANGADATRIAIAYEAPEGLAHDTLVASAETGLTSWSRVFDRDALASFSITAENLPPADSDSAVGFVSVSLIVDQETVAFDTSRTSVTLSY